MPGTKPETTLRTLILDDEFRSRSSLRILLGHHFPQLEIVGEAETVSSAIEMATALLPDIVFLDIELPDGSAFDFLDVLPHLHRKAIIVSAHPQHSVRAFKYATAHYLLKPIELSDLREAVARVISGPATEVVKSIAVANDPHRLALPTLEGFRMVALKDIVYCEAESNYTIFYFLDKSSFVVSNNLGHYEEILANKPFFRVHNKFLIHLDHIKVYHRGRGGWVEMSNGKQVEVSARRRDGFLARLAEFTSGA